MQSQMELPVNQIAQNPFQPRKEIDPDELADLSFLFTLHRGDPVSPQLGREALAILETRHQTPYYFNLHVDDVGHTLVLGATGRGKSFSVNFFTLHAQKYEPLTVIFELGHDFRKTTTLLGGGYVNRFNYFDRSYKVIPQIGDAERSSLGPLLDLKIKTPSGELVPVSTFTHITTNAAPRSLQRFQQRNAVRIFGGVKPGVTKEEGLAVLETTAATVPGVTMDHAGESRQIRREGSALTATLAFAVILIYLVLAAQFQSFRDPLIVLLGSVPLAISGALTFSFLELTTLNIYSQVGLITLVGLIAKNGILIVQFANTLQQQGLDRLAAAREAALTRLRPVLMTSAATVFGHLPLVFASGPGSEARNSIGTVLVTGMTIGTVFTLFVVPVVYGVLAAQHRARSAEDEDDVLEPSMAAEVAHA